MTIARPQRLKARELSTLGRACVGLAYSNVYVEACDVLRQPQDWRSIPSRLFPREGIASVCHVSASFPIYANVSWIVLLIGWPRALK